MQMLKRAYLNECLVLLSDAQISDPYSVLVDFVADFQIGQLRNVIGQMAEVCLTTESPMYQEAEEREDLLYYSKRFELLIEAAWIIATYRKTGKNEPPKEANMTSH